MRAMVIPEFGGPDKLERIEMPRPRAGRGEVLIRVVSAGVGAIDCEIRGGRLTDLLPHEFPLIPGWDVAGVLEELGEATSRFRKGDRVWACARKPIAQWGCYAEYVAVAETAVARMPAKLLFEEAAALPLAALTAQQCLFDPPGLGAGQTVLVHAAAGGVGHFAVQLASNAGATVYGTAGVAHHPFVLEQGAAAAIDYVNQDFGEALRRHCPDGVDLVLDAVGGETLRGSYELIKPGGRLVSIVERPDPEIARRQEIRADFRLVEPDSEQLELFARLVDAKRLRPHVERIYPLAKAAEAHRAVEQRHVRGKLVLNL